MKCAVSTRPSNSRDSSGRDVANRRSGHASFSRERRLPLGSAGGHHDLHGLAAFLLAAALLLAPVPSWAPPGSKVDILIDGNGDGVYGALGTGAGGLSVRATYPGTFVDFLLEVQNEGGRADAFRFAWNTIPAWIATVNDNPPPFFTGNIPRPNIRTFTLRVQVPPAAVLGSYDFIIDVVSQRDPTVVESARATVTVLESARVDLVIGGSGLGLFGALGSGAGGAAFHTVNPGGSCAAALDVWNVGEQADSFRVSWQPPPGWPAGSVVVRDGLGILAGPFWTPLIVPGSFRTYAVEVSVPASAGAGFFDAIVDAYASLPPGWPESVRLTTGTAAVVTGRVFSDRDADGLYGSADQALPGVTVIDGTTGLAHLTGGGGGYALLAAGGAGAIVIERNLSGYVSLGPDSVGPVAVDAGDTLRIDFADVGPLTLSAGGVQSAVVGGYADFPHALQASTKGGGVLAAVADSGVVTMIFLDLDANGFFDGADRPLESGDLDFDPSSGAGSAAIIVRAFVPLSCLPGTTLHIGLEAQQTVSGTPIVLEAQAADAVVVAGDIPGRITLRKEVDAPAAPPGSVLTYTITFMNAGADSVRKLVLFDPISAHADPLAGAFGPGLDVQWSRQGSAVYLTLDPSDGDECEYRANERLLRLTLSKTSAYSLTPGERGTLVYRVIVK